jgi:glycosyltransferase involved in cell wall biosynthesis
LFAGNWIEKKRPLDWLRAFAAARLKGASLVFVGAGELEAALRREAATIPEVYFAPFQNQSQMPRTYALADLFVLPSYGAGETWGLAVNEAMAMGKGVVVSDHVGCAADLVSPGENGLVFRAGEGGSLAAALQEAWAEPERLRRWGEASLQRIRRFSYREMTAGLEQAVQGLG